MREPLLTPQVPPSQETSYPTYLNAYLYTGHFLARWGARMWEFSVGLYMISIWPNSLLLAAVYGVVESGSTALFGSTVGQLVDRLSYVKVLQLWLLTQNLSFVIAGGTVIGLLAYPDLKSENPAIFILLVTITNISGAIGVLSIVAGTILVEREWVVVISEGQPTGLLTKMNSIIRRNDLICKLFAPVVSGFIVSFVSLIASAMTLAILCTLSVWLQYWLLISVYNGIPGLGLANQRKLAKISQNSPEVRSCNDEENGEATSRERGRIGISIEQFSKIPFVNAWIVYLQQDVVVPGISLALLYFTVLSFGTLMIAALEWEGIPAYVIGIARGVSATIGITATVVYPIVQSRILTIRTGLWSIWSQWTMLLICVGSIWVQNSIISSYMLMGGVAASRLGLWMFDLAVIQHMQDKVPESDRCVVGGVQNSLQSSMDLLGYVMGIIISNPQDFWKLTIISCLVVTLAAILYTIYVYRVRKHLIHVERFYSFISRYMKPSSTTTIRNEIAEEGERM